MPYDISPEDRIAIENLLTEFGWLVDHGRAGEVADLFTEQAVLATPMFTLSGSEAIAKQFSKRAKDDTRISRHIWTNLRLTALAEDRVKAEMIVQTYVATGKPPAKTDGLVVGDSLDIVEKQDGVWRFSERRLVVAFKGGD